MSRRPDDALRFIEDILHEMDQAIAYVEDTSKAAFQDDERTVRAVIRCLEVIGEATKQIPADLRDQHQGIPWREMARDA